jgi:hypothetical protein
MSEIDWKNAPEGATHYCTQVKSYYKPGNKNEPTIRFFDDDNSVWLPSIYNMKEKLSISSKHTFIERPNQQETKEPSKKHVHHDSIVKWALDPSQTIWYRRPNLDRSWLTAISFINVWSDQFEYYIGEFPPRETICIGRYNVPKPLTSSELQLGKLYYYPIVHLNNNINSKCVSLSESNKDAYKNLHTNREDAILHSKALRSLSETVN